jgi:asparagine synthase (glutamine-hydrolysing)
MCGIAGILDFKRKRPVSQRVLELMTDKIVHRGPDDSGYFVKDNVGLGFRRLSILDLEFGNQPFFSEDKSIVSICNGEIFNYRTLRKQLRDEGYKFNTNCDVEVLIPLYQKYGEEFVRHLNGQFAIAIFDRRENKLLLYRDHVGIAPLFYTIQNGIMIFSSEIKAILEHPEVERSVDFRGLDQVFTFPGVVSPTTMFKGICALKPGHYLVLRGDSIQEREYWDLNYPIGEHAEKPDEYYIEQLDHLLREAVSDRLNADVPVGYYLSGGLDSSLIAGLIHHVSSDQNRHAFSISFADKDHDESAYQKIMLDKFNAVRHELKFDWQSVSDRLMDAVYYSETPLKESYNTCSIALSGLVRENNIKVILTGEGADELFAGYVGYRFDEVRSSGGIVGAASVNDMMEDEERKKLWGDHSFFYEKKYYELRDTKLAIYSQALRSQFENFNAVSGNLIDKRKIHRRNPIHKRSYIDFKLRLSDHLLADHGDRVAYRNSIEARYPFLDVRVIEFAKSIPPRLKLNGLVEKYILKKVAQKYIPDVIVNREKFHFVAPGSPSLLAQKIEWIEDMLSYDTIKRQGYFDPDTVESIKNMYRKKGFKLNLPFDTDLLIIILTFGMFLDLFDMPNAA